MSIQAVAVALVAVAVAVPIEANPSLAKLHPQIGSGLESGNAPFWLKYF